MVLGREGGFKYEELGIRVLEGWKSSSGWDAPNLCLTTVGCASWWEQKKGARPSPLRELLPALVDKLQSEPEFGLGASGLLEAAQGLDPSMNEALTLANGFLHHKSRADFLEEKETALSRSPKCASWSQTHLGNLSPHRYWMYNHEKLTLPSCAIVPLS